MSALQTTAMTMHERPNAGLMLMNPAVMQEVYKFAELMANSATLPDHFKGNVADCMAITMQSMQWGLFPFSVAQKTHQIKGVFGYESQLIAAVINTSGILADRFNFEWFGPWEKIVGKFAVKTGDKGEYRVPDWKLTDEAGCGVRVWATLRGESSPRVLELLLAQARTRNSTLWADDPKQQIAYLAQKRWARLYAPDAILGVYSADELEDRNFEPRDINPMPESSQGTSSAAPKSSLKSRTKQAEAAPIEAEVVVAQQQAPANAPDFGDDEPEQFSPEVQSLMSMLIDCYEPEHMAEWKARVQKFPKNSPEYIALVGAYNNRLAELKAQKQGE
jgi:hypothetical protein